MNTDWVDFREIKAAVSFERVLDHYGINWLRKSRGELRGRCPIHKGEGDRTFHVNIEKGAFNCFSCRAKGNVLDFTAAMEICTIRDAALKLKDWFLVDGGGEGTADKSVKPAIVVVPTEDPEAKGPVNPPLKFHLKVDSAHEYGLSRGFSKETLEHFGAGLCLSKGMFAGRFVVPLHDEEGSLVGYAGRSIDDSEPKYLFPSREKGFYKSQIVFNLERVIAERKLMAKVLAKEPVVVVEGFFDVMRVEEAGFPCVGLLGCSLSQIQEKLLVAHFNRLILLFDGDEAGRKGAQDALSRLAKGAFVSVIDLPDGSQPDSLSAEDLGDLLDSRS